MLLGATAPLGLLKAQERLRTMKGSIDIDYKALQTRVGRFLKGSSQTLAKSLAAAGITLYEGRGVCAGKGRPEQGGPDLHHGRHGEVARHEGRAGRADSW